MKLFYTFFLGFAMLLATMPSCCKAQDDAVTPPPKDIEFPDPFAPAKKPVAKDYKETLDAYTNWANKFDDATYYSKLILKHKTTKEEIPFNELPEIERDVFFLFQGDVLSNHLTQLKKAWNDELAQMVLMPDKEAKDPTKKQVVDFSLELEKLRKSHAVKYEAAIERIFEKHKETMPESERTNYLKKVRDWHDQQKLIERDG